MTLTKLLSLTIATVAALTIAGLAANVRAVGAEDDCAFGTWSVQRTPVGLFCVFE